MTDNQRQDFDREMDYIGRAWRPLNRRQERENLGIEIEAFILAFAGCTAFWVGLAWALKIARTHFHV